MSLQTILAQSRESSAASRRGYACRTPRCCDRLPCGGFAKISGRSGRVTLEGVRMSRNACFLERQGGPRAGYRWRPPVEAFEDAVHWFRARGLLR